MTVRLFLTSARILQGAPQEADIPVERLFINASELTEVWVDTESARLPAPGKSATFALSRDLRLGFVRLSGTVERKVQR